MPVSSYPLPLPTVPGIQKIKLTARTQASFSQSPFTGSQQTFEWPAEWWEAEVTLPPMKRAAAEVWNAWLLNLRGRSGTFLLGDSAAKNPQGSITVSTGAAALIDGATQGPKIIALKNLPTSSLALKAGDYFSFGHGANATRVQTSGGTSTDKFGYNAGTSVNLQPYVISVRVLNVGPATINVRSMGSALQPIASGVEASISFTAIGDGVAPIQLIFTANAIGDSMAFAAWAPRVQRQGVDENFIPVANQNFTGWIAVNGASIGVSQNYNQRLYKSLTDVTSDSSGKGQVEIFPRWRAGDLTIDGDWISTSYPKGIFRLASNVRSFDIDEALVYGISFQAVEAL